MANDPKTSKEIQLRWSQMTQDERKIRQMRSLLDDRELARADRFRVDSAYRRFVAARATLRHVLGEAVDLRPEKLAFRYGNRGKPRLPDSGLHFNASDSGDIVVVGLAHEELGVDVEIRHPLRRPERLARRICSVSELETWSGIPSSRQQSVLLRLWTCKEAVLKAAGVGLSGGLSNAVVDLQPDGSTPRASFFDLDLTLLPFRLPAEAIGTVAIGGNGWSIVPSRIQL